MNTSERARAALCGLAIGDALGMPTQLMSREQVRERFGRLTGFEPADPDHPIAVGMPAGSITDDTEQALIVAEALVKGGGHVDPVEFSRSLIEWENRMRDRGSLDLLGPSTTRAIAAVLDGTPVDEAGRFGTTNGAAMRIAAVGIAVSSTDLVTLVDRVVEASLVTHNTGVAIAGASAVAAAISAGIDGASLADSIQFAIEAATLGAPRGSWVASASVARRIRWATELAHPNSPDESEREIYELIGTSLATQESVPAAFGILASFPADPWAACLAAASLGGDSDTIAAMAGAIGGAVHELSGFPETAIATVRSVNDHRRHAASSRLSSPRPWT